MDSSPEQQRADAIFGAAQAQRDDRALLEALRAKIEAIGGNFERRMADIRATLACAAALPPALAVSFMGDMAHTVGVTVLVERRSDDDVLYEFLISGELAAKAEGKKGVLVYALTEALLAGARAKHPSMADSFTHAKFAAGVFFKRQLEDAVALCDAQGL